MSVEILGSPPNKNKYKKFAFIKKSISVNHATRQVRITVDNLGFEPKMLIVRFPQVYTNGSYTTNNGNAVLSRETNYPELNGAGHYNSSNGDSGSVLAQAWTGNWWTKKGFDITVGYVTSWSSSNGYSGDIYMIALG